MADNETQLRSALSQLSDRMGVKRDKGPSPLEAGRRPKWIRASALFFTLRRQECPAPVDYMHTGSQGSLWTDSWLKPDKKETELTALKHSTMLTPSVSSASTVLRLNKMCEAGMVEEALRALDILGLQGIRVSSHILNRVLQMALAKKDLAAGRRIHVHIVDHGLSSSKILCSFLIRFFSVCGDLEGARKAFYQLASPEVDAWRAIITAHVKHQEGQYAVQLYQEMLQSGLEPDAHVYVAILRACASMSAMDHGRMVHSHITATGHEHNLFVSSALIDMYLKCGSLDDACQVFRNLPKWDVVSCNSLLAGYVDYGCGPDAVKLFNDMLEAGMQPDNATFLSIVKACSQIGSLEKAKETFLRITELGLTLNVAVTNGLIDMYLKCGSVDDARQVFETAARKDVVSWSAMIVCYVQQGCSLQAFELFGRLTLEGPQISKETLVTILRACSSPDDLEKGQAMYDEFIKMGLDKNPKVELALMEMCKRCGSPQGGKSEGCTRKFETKRLENFSASDFEC